MKNLHKETDDEFRRRFFDYEEIPSDGLWMKINSKMQQQMPRQRIVVALSLLQFAVLMFIATPIPEADPYRGASLPAPPAAVAQTILKLHPDEALKVVTQPLSAEDRAENESTFSQIIRGDENELNFARGSFEPRSVFEPTEVQPETLIVPAQRVKSNIVEKDSSGYRRGLEAYFMFMPTLAYQRIVSNANDNIFISEVETLPALSLKRIGFRAELGLSVPLTKKLSVFSGIFYNRRRQYVVYEQQQLDTTIVSPGTDGEIIVLPKHKSENYTSDYQVQNLGIHVGLKYTMSSRRFAHSVGGGMEFQKAFNKNGSSGGSPLLSSSSLFIFSDIFYRMQYPADGKLRMVAQPTFSYAIYSKQNPNLPLFIKPFTVGLNIGVTYHFKLNK